MEQDEDIVIMLEKENVEFRKLRELHNDYERQIDELNKKHYLSDSERLEKKELKKKKLAAKDRLQSIIDENRH